ARLDAKPYVDGYTLRVVRVARFEVGVHGQVHRSNDFGDVCQRQVARHGPVGVRQPAREGEPGTGRGQRLKAEMTEVARCSDIPGIWNGEAAALMQLAEGGAGRHEIGGGHKEQKELSTKLRF